jgi:hypothetical protein
MHLPSSYVNQLHLKERISPRTSRLGAYVSDASRYSNISGQLWVHTQLLDSQTVVDRIQEASVRTVLEEMRTAYNNPLPGLPYPELPTLVLGGE